MNSKAFMEVNIKLYLKGIMIFQILKRKDLRPSYDNESYYDYLNVSARQEALKVRALIEGWFEQYDDGSKNDMQKRLQSSDDNEFLSAFYELFLFNLFIKLGYSVTVHPEVSNAKKPDFLIESDQGYAFYLEATLGNESKKNKAENYLINKLTDQLNETGHPNLSLFLFSEGAPSKTPRYSIIVKKIIQWLDQLDVQKLEFLIDQNLQGGIPKYQYNKDGWNIEFWAVPKFNKKSNKLISLQSSNELPDPIPIIKHAFKQKATRYSKLEKPYIIAINVMSPTLEKNEILYSLYGTAEKSQINTANFHQNISTHACFCSPNRPINTRVSAVIVTKALDPWNFTSREISLFHNLFSKQKINHNIFVLESHQSMPIISEENLGSDQLCKIFGLNSNWPEQ
jgi:hypothetical protein